LNNNNILWNNEKPKLKYDILDKDSEEEEETKEDFYAGKFIFFIYIFDYFKI